MSYGHQSFFLDASSESEESQDTVEEMATSIDLQPALAWSSDSQCAESEPCCVSKNVGGKSPSCPTPSNGHADDIKGDVQDKEQGGDGELDPKLFKTSLCSFYLQGICKNGDKCHFAHGTTQLRLVGGEPLSNITSSNDVKRPKTILCVKFVANGTCRYGANCTFAHSVKEVKIALEMLAKAESTTNPFNNPTYKTMMCQSYLVKKYCSFGDKCTYAHGIRDLREKPAGGSSIQNLPEEVKKKRIEKAKSTPGYKTKICQAFEGSGTCEYAEMCHFAHGKDELREDDKGSELNLKQRNNPFYKSVMCKNKTDCAYGEHCVYAHTEAELKKPSTAAVEGSKSKTKMCNFILTTGRCTRGASCKFAHRAGESMAKNMLQPTRFGHLQMESDDFESGYKTSICEFWKETGVCQYGSRCRYAHGTLELRTPISFMSPYSMLQQQQLLQQQRFFQPDLFPQSNSNEMYKVSMGQFFKKDGFCEKGDERNFAHGEKELRGKYKTILCKMMSADGNCPRGDQCRNAHNSKELRATVQGSSAGGGSDVGFGGLKRKQEFGSYQQPDSQYKIIMCNKYMAFGKCPFGDNCSFAHGEAELAYNKRLRL